MFELTLCVYIYIYTRAVHKETDHLKYPDSERAQHAGDGGVV